MSVGAIRVRYNELDLAPQLAFNARFTHSLFSHMRGIKR